VLQVPRVPRVPRVPQVPRRCRGYRECESCEGAFVRDVKVINPAATDRQILLLTRIFVVVLGAVGFVASRFFTTVLEMAL
jgi:hypothetical protein